MSKCTQVLSDISLSYQILIFRYLNLSRLQVGPFEILSLVDTVLLNVSIIICGVP